jgi:hypothetical protein
VQKKITVEPPPPQTSAASAYTPALGIKDVAVGLDATEAAIKNHSVTTEYKKRHVNGVPFDASRELILVTKSTIESRT